MLHVLIIELFRYTPNIKLVEVKFSFRLILVSMVPAYVVHAWLLLFILGSFGIKALYPVLKAVRWAQWFLKQGNQKPFEAIGLVAAAVMFVITVLSKISIGVP
jgi:hypothetical protein